MPETPFAEYAARNTAPVLEVLRREFRQLGDDARILEIGSGTGQHAVAFAAALRHLHWQTSDLEQNHAGINAWIAAADVDNVAAPWVLDVRNAEIDAEIFAAAYSSNTAHIMGIDAVASMFALVAEALREEGVFCLYGPFRVNGAFNTASNEAFDASLRSRDAVMGIRDIEQLDEFAAAGGLTRQRLYAMPSNNSIAVWKKVSVT